MPITTRVSRNLKIVAALTVWLLGAASARAAGWAVLDDAGSRLDFPSGPPQRIVSLAPGATAMLFAAGAGDRLVGTANFSDEPDAARAIERVSDALSVNVERILQLKPDVVVVWDNGNAVAQIAQLQRLGLKLYHHRVERLADLPRSLRRLGLLAGRGAQAEMRARQLETQLGRLRSRYRAGGDLPSILIQVWDQPIYTVGGKQLLSDVVDTCGYRNVFADLTTAAPAISVEAVLDRKPHTILALGEDGTLGAAWLERWRRFPTLPAVRDKRLVAFNDPRLTRLGPGAIDATEALCAALAGGAAASMPRAAVPAPIALVR